MKVEDLTNKYRLTDRELRLYIGSNIILVNADQSEIIDNDIPKIGELLFLRDAGLSEEEIVRYFKIKSKPAQSVVLRKLRSELLDGVHEKQKLIDKIDYIIHEKRR